MVFYRGHKYVQLLAEQAPTVQEWLDKPREWRTVPVPVAPTYFINPFLRRLGKYVA